jgi:hypothetical protein
MKCTVVGNERRMLRKRDFTEGVLQRFCREFWIQLPQRGTQPFRQKSLAKTAPLRCRFTWRNFRSVQDGIIQVAEPPQGSVFDCGFRKVHLFQV